MESYKGRVAVVTGASAGIGAAIVKALLDKGLTVVGLARRVDKIKECAAGADSGKLHARQCDMNKPEDIEAAIKWVDDQLGGVDVLVNNAGVFTENKVTESETSEMKQLLDVNVLGLAVCTREAVKSMLSRKVDDGFIINIGSTMGHMPAMGSAAMYSATKHAVREITEGLRKELTATGSNIRVCEISPGVVKTEILTKMKNWTPEVMYKNPHLLPEDIAAAVVYVMSQPLRVQVHEVLINPTRTPL